MVTKHRASQARNHCLPGASVETSVYWACTNRPRVCNSIGLLVCIIWCPCGSWWPAQNGPTLDLEPRSSSAALLALRPNQHPVKVLELTRSLQNLTNRSETDEALSTFGWKRLYKFRTSNPQFIFPNIVLPNSRFAKKLKTIQKKMSRESRATPEYCNFDTSFGQNEEH